VDQNHYDITVTVQFGLRSIDGIGAKEWNVKLTDQNGNTTEGVCPVDVAQYLAAQLWDAVGGQAMALTTENDV
jgi:hypothetical protein